jgi:hypothetical protein
MLDRILMLHLYVVSQFFIFFDMFVLKGKFSLLMNGNLRIKPSENATVPI